MGAKAASPWKPWPWKSVEDLHLALALGRFQGFLAKHMLVRK